MTDKARQWFRVIKPVAKADSKSPTRAQIHINDAIGADLFFGGVDAAELIAEIDGLAVDELDVRINSEGGSAFDGLAIANAIIRNPASTTTYVDGLAASAASLVALAGDKVVMSKYGQMMLHNSRAGIMGSADDMRDAAKFLDSLNASMADFYADRAGGDAKDWAKAMAAETWYRAGAALDAGLITEIDESAKREDTEAAVAAALARPTARFKQPAPPARADSTKAAASVSNPTEGVSVADKKTLAESLGLSADATDEEIIAATQAALGITDEAKPDPAKPDDVKPDDATKAPDLVDATALAPELAAALATAQKFGAVLVPTARLDTLERQATEGATARAEQITAANTAVVDAAFSAGKIGAEDKPKYMALMAVDPMTTAALLAGIPAEARAPMTERGHGTESFVDATASAAVENDPRFQQFEAMRGH